MFVEPRRLVCGSKGEEAFGEAWRVGEFRPVEPRGCPVAPIGAA